jgi:hypothetical protein
VVAFTFRSETPTAVFDREKERQQTKLSPSLTVVAFTFRSETPTAVFDREKECQQTKQSHTTKTGVILDSAIVILFKKNESIKEKKCNLRHLGVILDISSGFHLSFQQLTI